MSAHTPEEIARKKARRMVTEIDHAELTIRLLEIGCKMKRPPGQSGAEALAFARQMAAEGRIPAYIVADFEAMAVAAIEYFAERISALERVQ